MTDPAVDAAENPTARTWSATDAYVRQALTAIKRGAVTTADELVTWDYEHDQRLFDWNDLTAAARGRRAPGVLLLKILRGVFDKMRIRALIHVREDADAVLAIEASGYFPVEMIADHPGMRAQVISDLVRRMKVLASELRLWKLTREEQAVMFRQLAEVIDGTNDEAA
jgi:hypothetical protein